MREIKFRLWSKSENCFVNPNILEVWDESGKISPYAFIKTGKLDPIYMPVENYIIQQWTGCFDKEKRDIYEGDIIEYNNGDTIRKGVVEFAAGIFFVIWPDQTDDELGYMLVSNIKVIGNIFEHKDLLH